MVAVVQESDLPGLVRKAVNLFTFLGRTQQLLVKPVRTVDKFEKALWLGDLPEHPAVHSAHRLRPHPARSRRCPGGESAARVKLAADRGSRSANDRSAKRRSGGASVTAQKRRGAYPRGRFCGCPLALAVVWRSVVTTANVEVGCGIPP